MFFQWLDKAAFLRHLYSNFQISLDGYHGPAHWARVQQNGLILAEHENVRPDVVVLFALLHDHMRIDEGWDHGHGPRAVKNMQKFRNKYFEIDQLGWNSLERAIDGHSDGGLHATPLVKVCWDADRLDLGRVDIMPDPLYLCTNTAKHPAVIQGAYQRSRKWVKSRL